MTRKDYELIARVLKVGVGAGKNEVERGGTETARAMAEALARDNPRFDRERFLRACGVQ